jgi:hypothetical protein
VTLTQVESRNWKIPDAVEVGLWMVGEYVPPVSQRMTRQAVAIWSGGKWRARAASRPPHGPTDGGGGVVGGGGGAVVVVVGGAVVVVAGGSVVVVAGAVVVVGSSRIRRGRVATRPGLDACSPPDHARNARSQAATMATHTDRRRTQRRLAR